MMENPLYNRSFRNPYRSPFSPVTQIFRYSPNTQPSPSSRKVVSVPIHFVDSDKTKSAYVLKIQKVFRGFLVRKSVKKLTGIKTEVDEIERRVSQKETINLIKKDSKERLRLNEMLMALLFRLDSVRGVNSGVRDLRKSVIKKAIMLQERIDAIVAGDQPEEEPKEEPVKEVETLDEAKDGEIVNETDLENQRKKAEIGTDSNWVIVENSVDQTLENESDSFEASVMETAEEVVEESVVDHSVSGNKEEEEEIVENNDESMPVSNMEVAKENIETEEMNEESHLGEKRGEEMEVQEMEAQERDEIEGRSDRNSMMERMMEKNEKLMSLVSELCEKNALQTQMISCLTQSVESLEKAFKKEKLKRKKRQATEKQEVTKCGRKL